MDAATVRAMLVQHFDNAGRDPDFAHAMYRDDAVLEFPQSGERFVGVANLKGWRRGYPASVTYEIRDVRGAGEVWVAELTITYDGGAPHFGVSILEFRDDRVVRETIYVAEGWEAPEWRRWRDDA